jgi:hypothetical protein
MMEGSAWRLPPGFRAGTVGGRRLRHLVPPAGSLGICGAPVAAETPMTSLAESDRVCPHCIDRITGKKAPAPQPLAKKVEPLRSIAAPTTVAIEVPRRIAELLVGVLDPVGTRATPRGEAVRYELSFEHARAVADVLEEVGETRESARIARALSVATSPA